ncbi:MAG TPA: hypothetical protein VHT51_15110 [Micropepsaceae bacterium]|jgi:hypothetical protein|nr:hypothetical protein [Micropepsaceae bacterium]
MFKSSACVAALMAAGLVSSAWGQQAPEDTSQQFFISCQNRFAAIFPDGARPMMRDVPYTSRTGASVPARQFYVERGKNRYSVTVVRFPTGEAVDEASIEFAAANLRKLGEVRFQGDGAYDPGFPGRQLNIFQPNNMQLRASVYMADHHLVITEANALVDDLPAIQFEQSITIIDDKGADFDTNPPDPVRIMPCNRN